MKAIAGPVPRPARDLDFLRSWLLALASSRDLHFTLRRGKCSRASRRSIISIGKFLLTSYSKDALSLSKKAKEFCVALRDYWAGEHDPDHKRGRGLVHRSLFLPDWFITCTDHAMRFSFWGRALPKLTMDSFSSAVAEQNERLASFAEPAPAEFLAHVDRRLTKIGVISPATTTSITSTSSCMEKSRKDGGRAKFYAECAERNLIFSSTALATALIEDEGYNLESRSSVVLEYGAKCRVVSMSAGVRVLHSEIYRKPLLRRLARFRPIGIPLKGQEDYLPIRQAKAWRGSDALNMRLFSADLTAATDYLSKEVIVRCAEKLGIPPDTVTGGTIDGSPINRGTLMGIPLSWPFLSLVHLLACDYIGAPYDSFYLKGDDLIAYWPKRLIEEYLRSLPLLTGMEINPRKSFIGRDRGFFCEKAYIINEGDESSCLMLDSSFVSVRSLCYGRKPESVSPHGQTVPDFLLTIDYLRSEIPRLGHRRAARLQTIAFPWTLDLLKSMGQSVFLPTSLGGYGFIPATKNFRYCRSLSDYILRVQANDPNALKCCCTDLRMEMPNGSLQKTLTTLVSSLRNSTITVSAPFIDQQWQDVIRRVEDRISQRLAMDGLRPSGIYSRTCLRSIRRLTKTLNTRARVPRLSWGSSYDTSASLSEFPFVSVIDQRENRLEDNLRRMSFSFIECYDRVRPLFGLIRSTLKIELEPCFSLMY